MAYGCTIKEEEEEEEESEGGENDRSRSAKNRRLPPARVGQ